MEPVARNEPVTERVGVVAPRTARTNRFPAIAWSSIIGGLVVGLATHMLMMLLGVAAGLTAVEFTTTGLGVQNVPEWSAAWNGLSMLLAAFVGGYVAARMSGLRRKADGVLHGFVAWGATTLLYAVLSISAMGALFGGVFSTVANVGSSAAGAAAQTDGGVLQQRLQALIGENTNINTQAITTENMNQLQAQLDAGDRAGATNTLVQTFGVESQRAEGVVDGLMAITGSPQAVSPEAQSNINQGVNVATTATWSLFIAIALSLIVALGGGLLGAKGARRAPRAMAV